MGAKDSKPSFISYEDAEKRVFDHELRRIREAFKRCAGNNGTSLSLEAFVHEVLCDGVPYDVAEWLYQACGGTKRGISFKDLLCGIVVLTKGNREEKIKFLWTLYVNNQSDNGTYIYKRDFARSLHLENTSLPVTGAQRTAEILLSLFGSGEKVTFEQFRSWLLMHKDATVLSQWLLSSGGHDVQDLETPTFYQSLAGVTHLEERDIIELEKCFWSLRNAAPTGQLDAESLTPLLSPPLPRAAVEGVILAFDENRDGHVDFKELCCGLSAACRGPTAERFKFCFKIFDMDRDGVLNKKELTDMVEILCTVANEALKLPTSRSSTPDTADYDTADKSFDPEAVLLNLKDKLVPAPKEGRKPMFQLGPKGDGEEIILTKKVESDDEKSSMVLTQEEFLLICSAERSDALAALVAPFLELLVEVGHIVLGLRPQCTHQERDIVLGWLRREVQRGYSVGQFWYLVGAEWWAAWLAYTAGGHDCGCRGPPRALDEAIVCDESFTSNSTGSTGSLLWRADTASLGSASSGVGSAAAARRPGPVDNRRLLAPAAPKVRTLTGEGGHLRRDVTLAQHRDFELLPDGLWRALALWYGGPDPLPRQVIRPPNSDVELELYPLQLEILRHVPSPQRASALPLGALGAGGGAGGAAGGVVPAAPERQLAYTAAFSRLATVRQVTEFLCGALGLARERVRLWALGASCVLLDDERPALAALGLPERPRLLLELRNPDLTWPEEIGALSGSRASERRQTLTAPDVPGATGLHNLGNTCFMNAALQSVWNTSPLTQYFTSDRHLYEVNTTNPLGTKGALALSFGELCKEVWGCRARSVAPLRVRWCVARHARALGGGGQHDAQELLAWLLDALHEDLNRRAGAPAAAAPQDSAGRPDAAVAAEAWAAFAARNHSILTDLFYGQLKSRVRCSTCGTESVRFDAFNMLSLPLPMDTSLRLEVRVILLDGSLPVRYGVLVNSEGTFLDFKRKLSELCGLAPESLLVVELAGATIGRVFEDGARLGAAAGAGELHAYELPPPPPPPHQCRGRRPPPAPPAGRQRAGAERSRSEIVMSQSPGRALYGAGPQAPAGSHGDDAGQDHTWAEPPAGRDHTWAEPPAGRDHTWAEPPAGRDHTWAEPPAGQDHARAEPPAGQDHARAEPRSQTLPRAWGPAPPSPRLPKVKFGSSPSDMCRLDEPARPHCGTIQYLIAVHRKQCRMDAYFLSSQRCKPALFGVPLLVGLRHGMCGRELYAAVWTQVARLLSAKPPVHDQSNHATDCDDSLGYEFPFTLRVVGPSGVWCGVCAWPRLCRGCALPPDDTPLVLACAQCPEEDERAGAVRRLRAAGAGAGAGWLRLAVEWEPTALHLRYQWARERAARAHGSLAARPARGDLRSCLAAFTADERLEQRYHCAACRSAQPATKKMQLWRLPPVLIIHLKRFQYVNNKWIKSQKVVDFPFEDFDPTDFLATIPYETIKRHRELTQSQRPSSPLADVGEAATDGDDDADTDHADTDGDADIDVEDHRHRQKVKARARRRRRSRLASSSLLAAPVRDGQLQDWHQHRLGARGDPLDPRYGLYAVVSHSGQLSGGHYVCYARNPSGAWLCYNDSACREVTPATAIDPAHAYLLFYQRRDLLPDRYLPEVSGAPPAVPAPEPADADLARSCALA